MNTINESAILAVKIRRTHNSYKRVVQAINDVSLGICCNSVGVCMLFWIPTFRKSYTEKVIAGMRSRDNMTKLKLIYVEEYYNLKEKKMISDEMTIMKAYSHNQ